MLSHHDNIDFCLSLACNYARWVEQDPKVLLSSVYKCMEQTLQSCKELKINPADIKGTEYTAAVLQQYLQCLQMNLVLP